MAGRNSQISRLYRILGLLEGAPQGLTVTEIWERVTDRGHSNTKRTIYRDLEAIESAGFPLTSSHDGEVKNKDTQRWSLEQVTRVTKYLVLSARELLALYLAREALLPLQMTPFYEDLMQFFVKVEAQLGKANQEHLHELSSEIYFEPAPQWGLGLNREILDTVRASCSERQVLEVEYSSVSSNSKRLRKIGPHYLYFSKGSVYLVGEDMENHEIKTFSVPRMSTARMIDEAYNEPAVEPETLFAHAIGIFRGDEASRVRLSFSRIVASYIKERRWHPTQTIVSESKTGEVEISLNVAITPELVQWVAGFGSAARVLEPALLREKIREQARAVLELYEKEAA
ncbi:MAG: WYL domain-containing protein [Methylotenera sp.]|nr:WYL domain-containing protein [Oligoflexia bacterium]